MRKVIAAEAQAAAAGTPAETANRAERLQELEDQLQILPISYPEGLYEFYGSLTLQALLSHKPG